ncbi:hypothetical protein [Brasilonema bromeliae]|uniref:hypothetical protein n=1 Tax=Brasilonema bromeliae TaxID=383615 RepID=UPI00145EA33F|nr:hypothetical protein [Brasilonema bromeliae]
MPFPKFKPQGDEALDKIPFQVKVRSGLRERIKAIPGWQSLLREKLEQWVEEWERNIDK